VEADKARDPRHDVIDARSQGRGQTTAYLASLDLIVNHNEECGQPQRTKPTMASLLDVVSSTLKMALPHFV
jgi:hypothetical protein